MLSHEDFAPHSQTPAAMSLLQQMFTQVLLESTINNSNAIKCHSSKRQQLLFKISGWQS